MRYRREKTAPTTNGRGRHRMTRDWTSPTAAGVGTEPVAEASERAPARQRVRELVDPAEVTAPGTPMTASYDPYETTTGRPPDISPELLDPDALKVVVRLRQFGHEAYFVGGAVRD